MQKILTWLSKLELEIFKIFAKKTTTIDGSYETLYIF